MKNFIACGDVFDVVAAAAVTSGTPFLVGDLLAVPATSGAIGETVGAVVEGVFDLPKRTHATSAAIAQGASVYWDDTNKVIDNTDNSAANKKIGWAFKAALSTDATVQVRLLG